MGASGLNGLIKREGVDTLPWRVRDPGHALGRPSSSPHHYAGASKGNLLILSLSGQPELARAGGGRRRAMLWAYSITAAPLPPATLAISYS